MSASLGRMVERAKLGLLATVSLGVWRAPGPPVLIVLVPYLSVMTAITCWYDCVDYTGLIWERCP